MLIGIKDRRHDTTQWINSDKIKSFRYDPKYCATYVFVVDDYNYTFDGDITEELVQCFDRVTII